LILRMEWTCEMNTVITGVGWSLYTGLAVADMCTHVHADTRRTLYCLILFGHLRTRR